MKVKGPIQWHSLGSCVDLSLPNDFSSDLESSELDLQKTLLMILQKQRSNTWKSLEYCFCLSVSWFDFLFLPACVFKQFAKLTAAIISVTTIMIAIIIRFRTRRTFMVFWKGEKKFESFVEEQRRRLQNAKWNHKIIHFNYSLTVGLSAAMFEMRGSVGVYLSYVSVLRRRSECKCPAVYSWESRAKMRLGG